MAVARPRLLTLAMGDMETLRMVLLIFKSSLLTIDFVLSSYQIPYL
jgi:hypothetical protein